LRVFVFSHEKPSFIRRMKNLVKVF